MSWSVSRPIAVFLLAGLTGCLATAAFAETAKMRPATTNEIAKHLKLASKDKMVKRNGYLYRPGNANGYKISHGQICVLFPNKRIDCSSISTDGTNFRMTLRNGDRYPL